jgi:hypothetical protein
MSVSICTDVGAGVSNSSRAVPFGIVSEPSSDTCRSTLPTNPITWKRGDPVAVAWRPEDIQELEA